jgi:hypothetical protein
MSHKAKDCDSIKEMIPYRLISALYDSVDESSKEHEEELSIVLNVLENSEDFSLFDSKMLDNLDQSQQLMPYYCSILKGIATLKDDKSSKRRSLCFTRAIVLIKNGKLSENQSKGLMDRLDSNIRLLREDQARNCVDKILDDFNPGSPSSLVAHGKAVELLGQLTVRAGASRRPYLIQKLIDLEWPSTAAAMLAAALVEMVETEPESESALKKISSCIVLVCHNNRDVEAESERGWSGGESIDPEELPVLIHQIIALTRKCDGSSVRLKALVLDAVSKALDSLMRSAYHAAKDLEDNSSRENKLDAILATIVHHLSLLASKDQGVSAEIISSIKAQRLFTQHPKKPKKSTPLEGADNAIGATVSSARILLALLVAKGPRQEVKVGRNECYHVI